MLSTTQRAQGGLRCLSGRAFFLRRLAHPEEEAAPKFCLPFSTSLNAAEVDDLQIRSGVLFRLSEVAVLGRMAVLCTRQGCCAVWLWVFPKPLSLSCRVMVAKSSDPGPSFGGQSDVEATLPACVLWWDAEVGKSFILLLFFSLLSQGRFSYKWKVPCRFLFAFCSDELLPFFINGPK